MRFEHLERVEISLRTLAPVFIGSGEDLTKKEYIFDRNDGKIHMPDLAKLTGFLSERSLIPAFESFLLHPRNNDLRQFLSDNHIKKEDYPAFVSYTIDAGEAARSEHFRGVLTFLKGADGHPYIPGSSVKGIIRTAIAAKLLKSGNFERNIAEIEQAADNFRGSRNYISWEARNLNSQIFCKLGITDPKNPNRITWDNMVNDFMRGISISDSEPVSFESLTLCGKYDRKPDGDIKQLPIFRECLAPGAQTRLVLTLDRPVLSRMGINVQYIEDALQSFSGAHYTNYEQHFTELTDDAEIKLQGIGIILGGGSGYVAKTLTYPLIKDRSRALKVVSKMMSKQFPIHKHEKDMTVFKVSPHTLKTTLYKGSYFQMGKCELILRKG